MKDFVKENDAILDEWFSRHLSENYTENQFSKDGIMFRGDFKYRDNGGNCSHWYRVPSGEENEGWSNAPLRILYLTKDQNSQDCGAWDVREECYHNPNSEIEDNILRRQFPIHKNLVFSLYGIVESLRGHVPSYKEIETKALDKEILKISDEYPFARINCKKIIGTSECTDATLKEYLLKATDYLKKQILSLESDLILCCGSRNGNNIILNFLS